MGRSSDSGKVALFGSAMESIVCGFRLRASRLSKRSSFGLNRIQLLQSRSHLKEHDNDKGYRWRYIDIVKIVVKQEICYSGPLRVARDSKNDGKVFCIGIARHCIMRRSIQEFVTIESLKSVMLFLSMVGVCLFHQHLSHCCCKALYAKSQPQIPASRAQPIFE